MMSLTDDRLVPLVDLGVGPALAVDASPDLRALTTAAARGGPRVAFAADVPAGAVVACGHGERAMTAASLLERAGHTGIAVLDGGPADYAAAHDQKLVQGTEGSTA
ncbi:rhodanese-like domain-containing protein [Streptomyces hydrogenans]|uniref:rhodanese-like domain-containing protein n=1 Tax=Streptomyces hydrogenans TaxID=1873719 RepID=UPI0038060119